MFDAAWIGIAFLLGMGARLIGLPPLVGYLAAGFVLFGLGIDTGGTLDHVAEIGITLLLFTIGLKLQLGTLLRPQVWAVTSIHMLLVSLALPAALLGAGAAGLAFASDLKPATALLIGFALSFSSTVFAVKVLEDKGELSSIYGRTAIGILIMQDIAAVVFLAASTGKMPNAWALLLVPGLVPLRWLLHRIMDRAGHSELLILFGLAIALGGAQIFDLAGIKGDLGALILGVLLASHRSASELFKTLVGFKDVFLVGFFLSIGLKGVPGTDALLVALLLVLLLPLKSALYFWLLAKWRMRARTAFLASLNLSNYSEFGLIVAAIGAANGWLADQWLTTLAIALSLSFVAASPANTLAHHMYTRSRRWLVRFQHPRRLSEEEEIDPGDATVLIFGMGRVGTGAYDALSEQAGEKVVGIDHSPEVVARQRAAGRNVIQASATDPDFWARLKLNHGTIRLVMLAMPQNQENVLGAQQLKNFGYPGRIAAIAKYEDDSARLRAAGVHSVFNLYAEAGSGFAEDAYRGVQAALPESA
ncbi:MAG: cation:proton antiporter [Gammaproteobacteria bacterium]|nr:cation:proton antiporter [Gammaproteobacteria bacterium]